MWKKQNVLFIKMKIEERREWYNKLKASLSCIICEKSGTEVDIDFHHRDPSTKHASVSNMLNMSMERILEEIEKCDSICHRCHAILTNKMKKRHPTKTKSKSAHMVAPLEEVYL
jgi:hydroxymethylglutaryl-CoA reductase